MKRVLWLAALAYASPTLALFFIAMFGEWLTETAERIRDTRWSQRHYWRVANFAKRHGVKW